MDVQEANKSKHDLPWAIIVENLKCYLTDRTQALLAGVLGHRHSSLGFWGAWA